MATNYAGLSSDDSDLLDSLDASGQKFDATVGNDGKLSVNKKPATDLYKKYDWQGAYSAGLSSTEILDALDRANALGGYRLKEARKAGLDDDQIAEALQPKKAPEAPEQSGWRRAADVGISALKGAIGVPEAAVGLADIPTMGLAGKAAESIGFRPKEAKAALDEFLSDKQKAANKAVEDTKGFFPTIGAALQNPSVIGHSIVESIPSIGAGGVVARGLGAMVSPITAAALGEGVVGAGSAAEQIRQETNDGLLTPFQSAAAVGSGIGTSIFGAIGGKLSKKLGITDVDTYLATGKIAETNKGIIRRIVEGGISEGVFEELPQSVQEQMWQNAALNKPIMQGVPEAGAMGMLAGVGMGGAGGFISKTPTASTVKETGDIQKDIDAIIEAPITPIQPRGSFGMIDELANFAAEEKADVAGRRNAIAADTAAKEREFADFAKSEQSDLAYLRRDAALEAQKQRDFAPALEQVRDQTIDQANALTRVSGVDSGEPTAMQRAMQAAQEKRNAKQLVSGQSPAAQGTAPNEAIGSVVSQAPEAVQAANPSESSGVAVNADLANTESRLNPANSAQESRVEPAVPNLSTTVPNSGTQNGVRDAIDQLTQPISHDDARALVAGKTEKVGGVDPLKMIDAGEGNKKQYRLGNMPLSMFRENESGDRYDGTVDAKRAAEYAQRPANEMPPVIALVSKDGTRLNVLDGGHRISAARMRGDSTIPTLISLKNGVPSANGQPSNQQEIGRNAAGASQQAATDNRGGANLSDIRGAATVSNAANQQTGGGDVAVAGVGGKANTGTAQQGKAPNTGSTSPASGGRVDQGAPADRRTAPRYNPEVDAAFKRARELQDSAKTPEEFAAADKALNDAADLVEGKANPKANDSPVLPGDRTFKDGKLFKSVKSAELYKKQNNVPKSAAVTPIIENGKQIGFVLRPRERTRGQVLAAEQRKKARVTPDATRDNLWTYIGKLGGLNPDEIRSTWGIDRADKFRSSEATAPTIRAQGQGESIDSMLEKLRQAGFKDAEGKELEYPAQLEEMFKEGDQHHHPIGRDRLAQLSLEARAADEQRRAMALPDEALDEFDQLAKESQSRVESTWDSFKDEAGADIHGESAVDELNAADEEYTNEFDKREAEAEAVAQDRERSVAQVPQDEGQVQRPESAGKSGSPEGNTKDAGSGAVEPVAPTPTSQERVAETGKSEQVLPKSELAQATEAIKALTEALTLQNQTPADLQAKKDAEDRAKKEADNAARAADRKQANALERDAKKKREARVIQEREAEKKNEIDAGVANFALGQEPPKPVEKKVSTDEGFGQGNVFGKGTMFSRKVADKQTNTPEFRAWFKDSKVVDAEGNPLVVYHGTSADFDSFDTTFLYSGEGASATGSGFYFTDSADSANRYSMMKDSGGNVMPVYLSLQNPLFIDFTKGETTGANISLTKAQVRKIILSIPNIRSTEDSPLLNFGDIGYEGFDKVLNDTINSYAGSSMIAALRNDFFGNDHKAWLKAFSKATGYDSAYTKTGNGDTHYVAWFPNQIKSAIGNRGTFDPNNPDIRFSRGGIWKSQMLDAIGTLMANQEPAKALSLKVEAWAKAGKFKQDELTWSGLSDWLKVQEGKVTKQQVQEFIRENGVQVEEVVLGGEVQELTMDDVTDGYVDSDDQEMGVVGQYSINVPTALEEDVEYLALTEYADGTAELNDSGNVRWGGKVKNLNDALRQVEAYLSKSYGVKFGVESNPPTKFSQYQLPGGENYRELLITLPEGFAYQKPKSNLENVRGKISARLGRSDWQWGDLTPEETEELNAAFSAQDQVHAGPRAFRSNHFDQPNILAHIRFNERVDAEGKRVLFLEEIQADKGQRWRKLKEAIAKGTASEADRKEFAMLDAMPFNSTPAWTSLALKRMVKYAIDNGFDRVAFTTGEQQAARYDLSKQISRLEYADNGNSRYHVAAFGLDGRIAINRVYPQDELSDVVGKELAEKIVNGVGTEEGAKQSGHKVLSGLDLKVGGEGMRGYYDKIIPSVANDLLKKLGGGKVETVTLSMPISTPEDFKRFKKVKGMQGETEQPGFTITPAMRESAQGGLPLFARNQKQSQSIQTTDARAATDVITKKWKNAPKINVHESLTSDSVPAGLRDGMEKEGITDARGAWYAGEIHLFPQNISSLAELERTVVHEARHYGLEGLFGKDMNPILMEIYMKDKGVRTEANRLAKTLKLSTVDAVNETLANMDLDAAKKLPAWKKLVAKMKAWLNDHGFTNLAKMLEGPTADEITKDILYQIEDFVKTGKRSDTTFTTTLFHRAFHGSPHDHDGFSLDKIGTGEGAQAYGWGLYFASARDVAAHYRDMDMGNAITTKREFSFGGKHYYPERGFAGLNYYVEDESIEHKGERFKKRKEITQSEYTKALEDSGNFKRGKLYEVELAPKIEDYLDWDKPLSEQSEKVKAALENSDAKTLSADVGKEAAALLRELAAQPGLAAWAKQDLEKDAQKVELMKDPRRVSVVLKPLQMEYGITTDSGAFSAIAQKYLDFAKNLQLATVGDGDRGGQAIYTLLSAKLGGDREASNYLKSIGIPGIKYLDGSSRSKGEGNHNFVIFDDKDVSIVAKYSRTDQTESPAFKRWFAGSRVVDENGKPLVVYHGTIGDFSVFQNKFAGKSWEMFSDNPEYSNRFALDRGGNVMPAFLSIKNPLDLSALPPERGDVRTKLIGLLEDVGFNFDDTFKLADIPHERDLFQIINRAGHHTKFKEALERQGYDGIIMPDKHDGDSYIMPSDPINATTYVAFRPEQIKSAIGNNGDFSPTNPDIRYSRAAADQSAIFNHLRSASTAKEMTGRIASLLESDNTFNRLTKNINTQFHKAQLDKDFKRVFDAVQSQMSDTEHYAIEAEKLAPDVLIRMQGFSDIGRTILQGGKQYAADMKAIAQPLFANIEGVKGVKQFKFTDAELKSQWNLTDKQIKLYHQYQEATAQSIDRLAQAKMLETAISLGMDVSGMKNLSLEDTHALLRDAIFQAAEDKRNAAMNEGIADEDRAKLQKEAQALYEIRKQLDKMNDNARELIVRGYTPAMRFGDYEVRGEVSDGNGKFTTEYMGRFESQAQANAMKAALQKEHPEWKITKGKVNPNAYKMLKGVSPESFELMAQITGNADEDGVKQYIALAKSSRAAEKRLLERQGIAGFSEDASRVLAAFVTSNARATAQALNSTAINEALASKTLAAKGDVQAEAQNLVEYVSNPNEEASKLRGLLFMHYMGGSIAAGLVNLTQPILQTAPHLSQYLSGVQTAVVMKNSAKAVATGKIPEKYKNLYQRAIDDGITEPHEIHQLMADAGGSTLGRSLRARAFVKAWGGFFSLSESFNRKVTFLAAIETAEQMGAAKLKQAGFNSPYEFAKDTIAQTQGIYNKGNRSNMARGTIGAILFTFKAFTINYVEWLSRLPKKQQAIALAMLVLASGLEGLPFADDLEDLIDTLGHRLGYATNSRKSLRKAIAGAIGPEAAEYVLHGSSRLTAIDLSGRLGMGNLIPGTAFFDPANKNKGKEILDVLGAAGGLGKGLTGALDGDIAGTLPTALKNIAKAYQMADTGEYKDGKGRLVMKTDAWDAIVKGIGFQPTDVAEAQKRTTDAMNDLEIIRYAKQEVSDKWAQGIIEKKPEMVAEARRELTKWNLANPDMRIQIREADITRKVKEAKWTRDQRILKSAPAGLKREVMADLAI